MTRRGKAKFSVLISLSACLAAGQIALAADKPANENSLAIGGAAAVISGYAGGTAEIQDTEAQTVEETEAEPETEVSAKPQDLVIAGAAGSLAAQPAAPAEARAAEAPAAETQAEEEQPEEAEAPAETAAPEETQPEEPQEEPEKTEEQLRQAAVDKYENLGLADVGGSYINVREEAGMDGKIIAKMLNNYACEILETVEKDDGYWYRIRSGSIEGYVYADYILTGDYARQQGMEAADIRATVLTETLNVRTEPTTESSIWTQLSNSEQYDVVQTLDGWYEIELDSSNGYVIQDPSLVEVGYTLNTAIHFSPEEIAEKEEQSLRSQIVDYAMQFLGNRYVWGGESLTNGVDCSGFTMKVYEHFGVYMSHYTGSQAQEGSKISLSEVKKGDLIFYAKNGTINHVAMYIGDGQVIHARSPKRGITITDMYYRTPVRAVTFLDD